MRGREVSRIEGFSDAAFGFALTLLVVSLEVPRDFDALRATLAGFLPFAATFAIVSWIWFEHYLFFRRFGLQDGLTVVLNCSLLFVVLFFVYPLKFVFDLILSGGAAGWSAIGPGGARMLMLVYGGGFIAVFAALALLYSHARRQRAVLGLSALEAFDAGAGCRRHLLSVGVGMASVALAATLPVEMLWVSGVLYGLLGPVHFTNGLLTGRARERLQAPLSSRPAPR
ncbi:MAG: TMEM175 family protein [Acidobacteriota bacterium]